MACVTIDVTKYEEECREKYGEKWLFNHSEKDPSLLLDKSVSRALLLWLKQMASKQQGVPFSGRWVEVDGMECCSECGFPRKISELDGTCVSCDAVMEGWKKDV